MIEKYEYIPTNAKERFKLFPGNKVTFRRVWAGPRGRGPMARVIWDFARMYEKARLR